jgi:hypothetical protein
LPHVTAKRQHATNRRHKPSRHHRRLHSQSLGLDLVIPAPPAIAGNAGIGIGIAPALIWEMSQFWDEMSQFWDEMSQFWGDVASATVCRGGGKAAGSSHHEQSSAPLRWRVISNPIGDIPSEAIVLTRPRDDGVMPSSTLVRRHSTYASRATFTHGDAACTPVAFRTTGPVPINARSASRQRYHAIACIAKTVASMLVTTPAVVSVLAVVP